MKRTRIEVISINRRVVSITGSDVRDGSDITDINVLLSALSDIASPAEQSQHEIDEGGVQILRASRQPLRLRLSRWRERLSQRLKTKRSNKP